MTTTQSNSATTPQTAPTSEAASAKEKNPFSFKVCTECPKKELVHGYLWNTETKEPKRIFVTLASVRAIRWMVGQMDISDIHKAELVQQAIVGGLAEEVEGDVETAAHSLDDLIRKQRLEAFLARL